MTAGINVVNITFYRHYT